MRRALRSANLDLRHDDFKAAETEFRAQLAACPEMRKSRSGLGAALQGAGPGPMKQKREFRRALDLDPGDFTALLNLGSMASDAGQPGPAAKLLEAAVSAKPTAPEAHEKLAAAYAQQGKLNDALTQLRLAAGLAQTDAKLHDSLSQCLTLSANPKRHLPSRNKRFNSTPTMPTAGIISAPCWPAAGKPTQRALPLSTPSRSSRTTPRPVPTWPGFPRKK